MVGGCAIEQGPPFCLSGGRGAAGLAQRLMGLYHHTAPGPPPGCKSGAESNPLINGRRFIQIACWEMNSTSSLPWSKVDLTSPENSRNEFNSKEISSSIFSIFTILFKSKGTLVRLHGSSNNAFEVKFERGNRKRNRKWKFISNFRRDQIRGLPMHWIHDCSAETKDHNLNPNYEW